MKQIRLVEWNINQRSSGKSIPIFVCNELIKNKADIVFLVEYKSDSKFEKAMKSSGYIVETSSPVSNQNEVLIAIKNDCGFDSIQKNEVDFEDSLNILSVEMKYNNKKICLIGTRVRVGSQTNKNEYNGRKKQLEDLRSYVESIRQKYDAIIIAGDFNHCQIRFEDDDEFAYVGYLQEPCNYQRIKRMFREIKLETHTPQGNKKEVFSWVGKRRYRFYIKEDHFIMSDHLKPTNIRYEWSFVSKDNEYEDLNSTDFKSNRIGRADHAMLITEINLKDI